MIQSMTLEDLSAKVQAVLEEKGLLAAQGDGRVSAAPDGRTVRYYTTLGLLDRPAIVSRQARYGRRHVLQLAAIKAMQAAGLPLAEIQTRLYARTDAELEALVASAAGSRTRQAIRVPTVAWREVTIEPGLKIMAEQTWSPGMSMAALEEKIRAAIAALRSS
jgi:DNA-binding transcriptional MerR regulator